MADPAAAREQAREILAQRRYHDTSVPRPFKGPLQWLGDRVDDVSSWIRGLFDDINGGLPGGSWLVWVLIALAVVVVAILVARLRIRRRVAEEVEAAAPELDPADFDRAADAAERAGDFATAVRLRFRAGVLRLERGHTLPAGGLRTTGAIGAELASESFDAIGTDFDEIAYGGRSADADDATTAREGWREVLR